MHHDVLVRFEQLLDEYLDSGMAVTYSIPTVKYFADKICLSPNYFGDLVKTETGKTTQKYIQLKMINLAKEAMINLNMNIKQIAEVLCFQHPQHFVWFFK